MRNLKAVLIITIITSIVLAGNVLVNRKHVITEKNMGNTLDFRTGQIIMVELKTGERTGYEWVLDENKKSILELVDKNYIIPENYRYNRQGIIQQFEFKIKKAGKETVVFKYAPTFSGLNENSEKFYFDINVK